MTSLPTVKMLFLIAMSLGSSHSKAIFITSHSESYVFRQASDGNSWDLRIKNSPTSQWKADPDNDQDVPDNTADRQRLLNHDWNRSDIVDLDNGNQAIKQGSTGFYVVDPGAPNQKVYTIQYSKR
jgi:hypothetical protein